jgi:hypothetical protein
MMKNLLKKKNLNLLISVSATYFSRVVWKSFYHFESKHLYTKKFIKLKNQTTAKNKEYGLHKLNKQKTVQMKQAKTMQQKMPSLQQQQ